MSAMKKASPLTLQQLNTMTQDAFVDCLGGLFERSPWVAAMAWQLRPFNDANQLIAAMCDVVRTANREEQLALFLAHPALLAREDRSTTLTDDSCREQHEAGLDQCTDEQRLALVRLNKAYLNRFGFPFIIAVRGLAVGEIMDAMQRRLAQDHGQERETAISEVGRIAHGRLRNIIEDR